MAEKRKNFAFPKQKSWLHHWEALYDVAVHRTRILTLQVSSGAGEGLKDLECDIRPFSWYTLTSSDNTILAYKCVDFVHITVVSRLM